MAAEKLVSAVSESIKGGMTEEQVREKLLARGWTKEDINGALAIHALSHKPIGSNLISTWHQRKISDESVESHWVARILFLLLLVGFGASTIDWYGYPLPYLQQYQIKNFLNHDLHLDALTPQPISSGGEFPAGLKATTTPDGEKLKTIHLYSSQ